jgi:hypothetical protein
MALLILAALLVGVAVALWYLSRNARWQWKLLARIAASAVACSSALILLLFLFGGAMCGRYDFPPASSADGRWVAQVSEEDCGAVDSFHSSVQLWRDKQGSSAHLLGKREHSTTVFTVGHDPRLLKLEWKDAKTLLIQYPQYPNDSRSASEFRCQSQWDDIQIECIAYTPDYRKPVGEMPPVKRWLW